MLHRVVMKRSGRRALAEDVSDFTAADHLICTIVRQARNFPAHCWNTARCAGSICAGDGADHKSDGPGLTSGIVTKTRLLKLVQGFRDGIPLRHQFVALRGSFRLPRAALQ